MNHVLSHEGNDSRTTRQTDILAHLSPPLQHPLISPLSLCFLASSIVALTICRAVSRRNLRPVAHSAPTRSSLVTTNLVHCALTARCWCPPQRDNQPASPLRTRQQDHSPTHQPTEISSTTVLLTYSHYCYYDQVEPVPALVSCDFLRPPYPFRLALIFTVRFVLLTEDYSNGDKALGEQQSQIASHQRNGSSSA